VAACGVGGGRREGRAHLAGGADEQWIDTAFRAGELCPSPGHLRPSHLCVVQEADRPLNNLGVDNSLTGGGFADHRGGGGDERLDPGHAHKIGRIRATVEGAVGLDVPAGQDRLEA